MIGRASEDLRRHNLSSLLRHLHLSGPASRAELTGVLGLNRSTVGDLVGDLAGAGLVTEGVPAPSGPTRAGRPSLLVRPRALGARVLALHLDVHHVTAALVGLGGEVLARADASLPPSTAPRQSVESALALALSLPVWDVPLLGVGVAVPGTVDQVHGVVGTAPHLGWSDVPLAALVTEVLVERLGSTPAVSVANDADLGMLAEARRGAARGCTDALYVCGTWGMGGGIITGGHPLTGARGHAGEIGHVGVNPEGRACHCGSRGCWEAEAMAGAWAAPLDLDPEASDVAAAVLERLALGGVAARRSRDRLSRSFARGLASMVNVLDPEVVVLGAGLWRDLWPELHGEVDRWLERTVLPAMRGRVDVRPSGLGADSTLLGAAETAFEPLLADPLSLGGHQRAG